MLVKDYFMFIEDLKNNLMMRDAITINGDLYFIDYASSSISSIRLRELDSGELLYFSIDNLEDWSYKESDSSFTSPDKQNTIKFFDLETYEANMFKR